MTGAAPKRRRGRIIVSLLMLLAAVGVVPLLATSYRLVSLGREALQWDQKTIQLDKARGLSRQIAIYMQSLDSQLKAIARTLEVDGSAAQFGARVARIEQTRALERYVDGTSPFYYVSLVKADCLGTGSGVQLPETSIQQALHEGCIRGSQGRRMVGHSIISGSLQEPVVVLGEPVFAREGAAEGVVLVVASLGPLWSMTRDMGEGGLMDVYVVDSRGLLVAHSDRNRVRPNLEQQNLDVSDVEIVQQFLANRGRIGTTVPFTMKGAEGPVKMLGTYTSIPDTDWGVIVQIAESKAYHAALEMENHSYALVAVVTLLAVILGTLFARQISLPIQQLARGARRLAGGDYSTRVPVKTRNEVGVLSEAFNHMGEEIQKAIDEVRRQASVNKELFLGSIRMLANAIDEKDPYTRGHSERVAYYSAVIAKHMGMDADEVEKVHLSGLIHDVGKIGIEDKILRKAAALTEEEYEMMKQHPRKGEHILEGVPLLKQMAGAGLMHHENVDGTGYPDGLKAEQIPLLGRIVSVADAFDAMTTDRPYSKAMTFEAALARLRFLAGKKFDLPCVEAMERASAAGDLKKSRRASIEARKQAAPVEGPGDPILAPTSTGPSGART